MENKPSKTTTLHCAQLSIFKGWGIGIICITFALLFGIPLALDTDLIRKILDKFDMNYIEFMPIWDRITIFIIFVLGVYLISALHAHRKIYQKWYHLTYPDFPMFIKIGGVTSFVNFDKMNHTSTTRWRLGIESKNTEIMRECLAKVVSFKDEKGRNLFDDLPAAIYTVQKLNQVNNGEAIESAKFNLRPEEQKEIELIDFIYGPSEVSICVAFERDDMRVPKVLPIGDYKIEISIHPPQGRALKGFIEISNSNDSSELTVQFEDDEDEKETNT